MTLTRTLCKHGHDLTLPNAYYTDRKGHKRCRHCQGVNVHQAYLIRAKRGSKVLRPEMYRNWADQTWNAMNDRDRALVAVGLKAISP